MTDLFTKEMEVCFHKASGTEIIIERTEWFNGELHYKCLIPQKDDNGNEHYFENHPCAKNTCELLQSFSQNIKERQKNNELIKWT